jgi:uncharacterized protein YciI
MLVSLLCFDKPGHADLRHLVRPMHLAWIRNSGIRITFAGPMLSQDGRTACGSIIIGEFGSFAQATAFAQDDPYTIAELFERVIIQPTRQMYPVSSRAGGASGQTHAVRGDARSRAFVDP